MRRDWKNRGISGQVPALCRNLTLYGKVHPITSGKPEHVECLRCLRLMRIRDAMRSALIARGP